MTFYASAVYVPEVEYSETPVSSEAPMRDGARRVEWRPTDWLLRAAATATAFSVLTFPVRTTNPIVLVGRWSPTPDQATRADAKFLSPPIPPLMLARARSVPQRYVSDPHPGHDDSLPDYDI